MFNPAIMAGLLFRHTLERLPVDPRARVEMLACVDDVVTALREYQQEAQWLERLGADEADGLVSTAADEALPEV